jgi:hypothetical protein
MGTSPSSSRAIADGYRRREEERRAESARAATGLDGDESVNDPSKSFAISEQSRPDLGDGKRSIL